MADTQATSGTTGTSIDPVELNASKDEHKGSEEVDRSAVGRASVSGEAPVVAKAERPASIDAELSKIEKSVGAAPVIGTSGRNGGPTGGSAPVTGSAAPIGPTPATGRVSGLPPAGVPGRGSGSAVVRAAPTRTSGSAEVSSSAPAPGSGAARVAEAVRSAKATVSSAAGRGPRRARLFVKRIDPWSVMKFSFAVSFVLFFVLVVATSVLYLMLDQMDVFSSVNKALTQIVGGDNNVKITAGAVIGAAGAVGLVGVVLLTALSTLGAFIYNVCADLVGGIEVTLSEKE